jgi:integrase
MRVFKQKYRDRQGKLKNSAKWYVEFKDHTETTRRIPGFTDKKITEELGRRIEKLVALRVMGQPDDPDTTIWLESLSREIRDRLGKCGILDKNSVAHAKSLQSHLDEFVTSLRNKNRTDDYWKPVEARIKRIVNDCGFKFISDISASQVENYLAQLKSEGLGQRTINHYLAAVKQFTRWLVMDRRTTENRLTHLKSGNANLDVRRERRELTDDEIRLLLLTARSCKNRRFTLNGWQRFTLYATALGTGIRAKELGSLTPNHFDFETDSPTVRIDATDEKSRRGDVLPLPADLVGILKPWIGTLPQNAPLWPGTWAVNKRAGKFMQCDLKRAGVAYVDDEGCYADFHALRHTYLSRLGRSGANPKVMQRLARHTTVELTLGRYTHANLYDLTSAVEQLPALPLSGDDDTQTGKNHQVLQATGTDDVQITSSSPDTPKRISPHACAREESVLPLCLPEKGTFEVNSVHLSAVQAGDDDSAPTLTPRIEKPQKNSANTAISGSSGSGWESNPPGNFSDATMGLKPRTVTRSAYTPGEGSPIVWSLSCQVNQATHVLLC